MSASAVEDHGCQPRRRVSARSASHTGLLVVTACVTLLGATRATRGQTGQAVGDFGVSVVDLSDRLDKIKVPLYGSVTVATSVEIARADVVDNRIAAVQVLSPTRLLLSGQGYGQTNVLLTGTGGQEHLLELSVELDLRRLNESIREVDPLSSAQAHSILGNIVLRGTVSSAARATRIVEVAGLFLPPTASSGVEAAVQNHLDVAGEQQVLLRCVIAEVSRSAVRELGINGFLAGDNFRDAFMINQIGGVNPMTIGAAADALATSTIPFLTDAAGIPVGPASTLSLGFPRVQMQLFIKALSDNSLLQVLAEPNLVAISGETATFLAGGEFPIPVPQGDRTLSIEFREYGVRLTFTPSVRDQQRIRLRVAPEVSEVDFATAVQIEGFVVPGLTSRATETTVELGSGETIAIAGLLKENVRALATRVPGLGEVPVLGPLFRSVSYQRNLTELVILVTPEIVSPLDAHQKVALPTDGADGPSDYELYALGRIEAPRGADVAGSDSVSSAQLDSDPDRLPLHGPWGHARPAKVR